jgi:hypothetical protein
MRINHRVTTVPGIPINVATGTPEAGPSPVYARQVLVQMAVGSGGSYVDNAPSRELPIDVNAMWVETLNTDTVRISYDQML